MAGGRRGFTLVEIMIVVGSVGILAVIGLPAYYKARADTQKRVCINNLRVMSGAKEQAALANMWGTGRAIASGSAEESNVLAYVKNSLMPICPATGTYTWRPIGVDVVCSLSSEGHVLPE